jgi:CBS-domain-containing membrane protein
VSVVLVRHIMSSPVVTFFAEQTIPLAEDVMRLKHVRHLPVVDEDGYLLGLVSHRDLLAAQPSVFSGLTAEECRARNADVRVAQIMQRDVWSVHEGALASVAGCTLFDHKLGCLPVLGDDRRLVGIVTEHDYLRFAIKMLQLHDGQAHASAPLELPPHMRHTRPTTALTGAARVRRAGSQLV